MRKQRLFGTAAVALGLIALAPLASATLLPGVSPVVFDQPYVNGEDSTLSDLALDGFPGPPPQRAWDDFQVDSICSDTWLLTDIHWWGLYGTSGGHPDDFTIDIFTDADLTNSVLGSPLNVTFGVGDDTGKTPLVGQSGRIGEGGAVSQLWQYDVILGSPIELDTNTTYYLSITNNSGDACLWYWAHSTEGESWFQDSNSTQPPITWNDYNRDDVDLAFALTGVVPEPASLSLLGIGLAGFAAARGRKRFGKK